MESIQEARAIIKELKEIAKIFNSEVSEIKAGHTGGLPPQTDYTEQTRALKDWQRRLKRALRACSDQEEWREE
jgi:hypothetical protein